MINIKVTLLAGMVMVMMMVNVKGVEGQGPVSLTGNWTGFVNGTALGPLFDWYSVQYVNSTGEFSVICSSGDCDWVNGTGQVKDTAVKLVLSDGKVLVGTLETDSTSCGWTDAPSSPCPLPPPFTPSCTVIFWNDNSTWVLLQPIDKVHLVFMNHLDVGYNGIPITGFINNILNIYFYEYFPRAISVAETMSTLNLTDGLVYTTHPWLLSLYLDCPPNLVLAGIKLKCPTSTDVAIMEAAIKQGWITWHRGPFNLQPENMESSLFSYSLSIASDLDAKYGFPPKNTLSQRDVPGMTRGVVPLLSEQSVQAISVGVNGYSCPPAVPRAFVWKDNQSNTDVIGLWHSGGYPNNPGPDPAHAYGLSRGDCVTIRGFRQALCWAFRTDNSGPPEDFGEVLDYFELTRAQFPGSQVVASTFDNFVNELVPFKPNLPVFTEEIGDVWIQGIPSDPFKMAQYRTIARARASCISSGKCSIDDPVLKNMSRWLIKPPEHTWGLPSVGDGQTKLWDNAQFEQARNGQAYLNCEAAWIEQRNFNQIAVATLVDAGHPLADIVQEELAALEPQRPSTSGYTQVSITDSLFSCFGNTIGFDKSGAISNFTDKYGETWANTSSPLGKLVYTTWDESGYNASLPCNLVLSGKPGSNAAHPVTRDWSTSITSLWQNTNNGQTCSFLVQVAMDNETVTNYGGFPEAWIAYDVSVNSDQVSIDIDYQWFSKTSTRLAESFMLNFEPVPKQGYEWKMNKLSSSISPFEVMQGGNQNQHAVWDGIAYTPLSGSGKTISIMTLDVPLVSPITSTTPATPLVNSVSPLSGDPVGFGFNLYNNVWNTNYIFWYPLLTVEGKDERLRFQVLISN